LIVRVHVIVNESVAAFVTTPKLDDTSIVTVFSVTTLKMPASVMAPVPTPAAKVQTMVTTLSDLVLEERAVLEPAIYAPNNVADGVLVPTSIHPGFA